MVNPPLTAAQAEVLRRLSQRFAPATIDRLWIFPPRQLQRGETGLFVVSLFLDPADATGMSLRSLVTVRYQADGRDTKSAGQTGRVEDLVTEEGRAPPNNIERVIAGVLARTGMEGGEPVAEEIGGSEDAWLDMLARVGLSA